MRSQTHCLNAGAFARRGSMRDVAAGTALATAAGDRTLLSDKTRCRDPFLDGLICADPTRVLIVSKFSECVAITTLVHSIGRFESRMACSAESALSIAGDFKPDIVLLTTALPDMASYRVAGALRWRSRQPAPRLIAITEDISTNDRRRALAAGFERYLTAPVHRVALEGVLLGRVGRLPRAGDGSRSADKRSVVALDQTNS